MCYKFLFIGKFLRSLFFEEKYLKSHIKVNGKLNNLGKDVHVELNNETLIITANIPLSKR